MSKTEITSNEFTFNGFHFSSSYIATYFDLPKGSVTKELNQTKDVEDVLWKYCKYNAKAFYDLLKTLV